MPITTDEEDKVREIIRIHLNIPGEFSDNVSIYNLGADDLDELEILMTIEDEFGIEMPDLDYETTKLFIEQLAIQMD